MKNKNTIKSLIRFSLILVGALAFALFLPYEQVKAQVTCSSSTSKTNDTDKDGFSDYDECYGIQYAGTGSISGRVGCSDRKLCLDPDTPDLFVIWVPAAGGYFDILTGKNGGVDWKPLEFISNPTGSGGLGIFTHMVEEGKLGADRTVCKQCYKPGGQNVLQKAVRVTEDLNVDTLDVFGQSNDGGTPNDLDAGRVFTKRIHDFLYILDGNHEPPTDGLYKYMKHTIAHEIGHSIKLRAKSTASYGGYHYKPGAGWVMDQSISCPRNATSGTLNIGTKFSSEDQAGTYVFKLK